MHRQSWLVVPSLLAFVTVCANAQTRFWGVGDPSESYALAVSGDGRVVVGGSIAGAFRWTAETGLVYLGSLPGTPAGTRSVAFAVSHDGSVIVGEAENAEGRLRAFRWTASTGMEDLGLLGPVTGGSPASWARAVSGDGSVIVGMSSMPGVSQMVAFRWTSQTGMQTFMPFLADAEVWGISADGSTVVGWTGLTAFRWHAAVGVQAIPSATYAHAASADGSTVVGAGGCGAFRWTAALGTGCLGTIVGDSDAGARGVSADGLTAVGWSRNLSVPIPERPFLWTPALGMRDLKPMLEGDLGLNLAGWTLNWAGGLSADGKVIVGGARNPCGRGEAFVVRIDGAACYADCNGDGALNLADFGCFQTKFALGDRFADCNGDCALNLSDFGCFQTRFALGCP